MQSHSRQKLLSQLLVLQPGREVTRDVVEAAIWQTIGWESDPRHVGRLLSVIDAFVDARARRLVAHVTGGIQPQYTAFGTPDRAAQEALAGISHHGPVTAARPAAAVTPLRPEPPSEFTRHVAEGNDGVEPPSKPHNNEDDGLNGYVTRGNDTAITVSAVREASPGAKLRTCTWCKNALPLTEFWRNKRGPGGYEWQCRNCKGAKKNGSAPARAS